ncbi:MAG: glycosyltransferase family 2 protein [Candidatus Eremiobacteraeota bacterium]|nr:glycosyltransferase family 2 protein [Candidatus Eremiobacteraeota bacterium]
MTSISIVIPCYNESDSVFQLRDRLLPVLDRISSRYTVELILVDDGSTDDTFDQLSKAFGDRAEARIVRHPKNLNLGGAIRTGIKESSGDLIANLDSDCTYDPDLLEPMLVEIERGADFVTVSPYHPLGLVDGVPPRRLLLSKGLSAIYQFILRKRIYTYTALNRVYRRTIVEQIGSPEFDFTCLAEMMLKALKQNHRVVEVPAVLRVRQFGQSKMKVANTIKAHLRLLRRLVLAPKTFLHG